MPLKSAGELSESLDAEQVMPGALSQVELLTSRDFSPSRQIAALEDAALNASESRDRESNAKIADLGRRLNVALAQRVQELNRYRSDFFDACVKSRSWTRRISVSSATASSSSGKFFPDRLGGYQPAGQTEMKNLPTASSSTVKSRMTSTGYCVSTVTRIMRSRLARTPRDNWELSSACATAAVKFLIAIGVPANRLVAAGFGNINRSTPPTQPMPDLRTGDRAS